MCLFFLSGSSPDMIQFMVFPQASPLLCRSNLMKIFPILGLAQVFEIDHSSCHAGETDPENLLRNFVCYQLGVCNQKSVRQLLWIFSQDGQYYWEDEI